MRRFDPSADQILIVGLVEGPEGKIRRVRFLVDTGTPHTVIDAPIMDSIGFGAHLATARSRLWGVSGVIDGYVVKAPRLRVLGHELQGCSIAVHDLPNDLGVEALLGLDFFRGCYVGIDFCDGTLEVRPRHPGIPRSTVG